MEHSLGISRDFDRRRVSCFKSTYGSWESITDKVRKKHRVFIHSFCGEITVNTKFDFKHINAVEAYNKLKTLDKNKATGIHNIPNKMLLVCADIVAPHLADIFNYSSVSEKFLDEFKIGKISPLSKNGERER